MWDNYRVYTQCPACMVMYGSFRSQDQMDAFMTFVHLKTCNPIAAETDKVALPSTKAKKQRKTSTRPTVGARSAAAASTTPALPHDRGEGGPTFESPTIPITPRAYPVGIGPACRARYEGWCQGCDLKYFIDDVVRMVNKSEGAKAVAMHDLCAVEWDDKRIGAGPQSDDPPF